ncbi:hypothetical protein JCM11491_004230 [Sporobolomyces phaffii]
MTTSDSNLRPLTLPSLSPSLARLSALKSRISALEAQVEQYARLAAKLETFTDEPTWNAYIPFGPLAFFPGQLVHTNDITQTIPPDSEPARTVAGQTEQAGETRAVLRSAKQARSEAERLRTETLAHIENLKKEVAGVESDLKQERERDRKSGKKNGAGAALGLGEDEDWTVNERGEVINEDGLPIFDIREDLPPEAETTPTPSTSSSKSAETTTKKPMRYLVKKGGKQVVQSLKSPASSTASSPPPSKPASVAAKPLSESTRQKPHEPMPSFPSHDAPQLDVRAILDELEAEEELERKRQEASDQAEQDKLIKEDEASAKKGKAAQPTAQPVEKAKEVGSFGGFSSGFLSKSKQKRPSNSLASPPPASTPKPTATPVSASVPAPSSPPSAVPHLPASPLKSSLSRSTSRASSPAPGSKKSVAFNLPVPDDQVPTREGTPKKQPIILGMGPTSEASAPDAALEPPKKRENFVRPIKDLVVEKPLKKPTPPGAPSADGTKPKKISRFRKMKEDMVEHEEEPKGKGKEKEVDTSGPAPATTSTVAPSPPSPAVDTSIPAPVHTISLSSKPSPSSSTSQPRNPDGTVSYADIPFSSDEEDPHLSGEDDDDDDEDGDWYPSEEEEFDEEDFDVDAALHQREVALEYHRQRLGLAAGRGTGALGGYHNGEESPFAEVVAQQGLVPSDATLDSLSSHLSHAAALGKPSRFRTSNKHLESASLIIPSVLASDPSLTNSHTMLGPAPSSDSHPVATREEDLEAEEEERMRRTLEALVEGRPLPEDEQLKEREKEIALREAYAKNRDSVERTAGKAPPVIASSVKEKTPTVISVPRNPPRFEATAPAAVAKVQEPTQVQPAASQEAGNGPPPSTQVAEAVLGTVIDEEKPKKMSRFRQKQLGLID